jgi:hypothetical protein
MTDDERKIAEVCAALDRHWCHSDVIPPDYVFPEDIEEFHANAKTWPPCGKPGIIEHRGQYFCEEHGHGWEGDCDCDSCRANGWWPLDLGEDDAP